MLHVIFAEGLEDAEFLAANATGVDALRAAVERFAPGPVARAADVPEADLVLAARTFASARRGGSVCGTGPSFATRGTLTEYLALCLTTVCGFWPRAGDPATRLNVLMPAFTPRHSVSALSGVGTRRAVARARARQHRCGSPDRGTARRDPAARRGRVRALFVLGGNPMMAFPDQRRTETALRALDLLVTSIRRSRRPPSSRTT
jgi:anaerobic selenocysteine-containing dehydrogenase